MMPDVEQTPGQDIPAKPPFPFDGVRAMLLAAFEPWMLSEEPEPAPEPSWLYRVGYPFGLVLESFVYVWTAILDGARAGFNDGRWN